MREGMRTTSHVIVDRPPKTRIKGLALVFLEVAALAVFCVKKGLFSIFQELLG